ncbi:hypothetical protein [Allofranklinella schreckenbergeri]
MLANNAVNIAPTQKEGLRHGLLRTTAAASLGAVMATSLMAR